MYMIRGLVRKPEMSMGSRGFMIDLSPEWPKLVKASELTQEKINTLIKNEGRLWLDSCGYDDRKSYAISEFLYSPNTAIRVKWGEWGAEHITVPGNACGLDLSHGHAVGRLFQGGEQLQPHNVDSRDQQALLLIVFTEIADIVMSLAWRP